MQKCGTLIVDIILMYNVVCKKKMMCYKHFVPKFENRVRPIKKWRLHVYINNN